MCRRPLESHGVSLISDRPLECHGVSEPETGHSSVRKTPRGKPTTQRQRKRRREPGRRWGGGNESRSGARKAQGKKLQKTEEGPARTVGGGCAARTRGGAVEEGERFSSGALLLISWSPKREGREREWCGGGDGGGGGGRKGKVLIRVNTFVGLNWVDCNTEHPIFFCGLTWCSWALFCFILYKDFHLFYFLLWFCKNIMPN
jgi:hypothetical protein